MWAATSAFCGKPSMRFAAIERTLLHRPRLRRSPERAPAPLFDAAGESSLKDHVGLVDSVEHSRDVSRPPTDARGDEFV